MDTSRPRKPFVDSFLEDVSNGFLVGMVGSACLHLENGGVQAFYKNAPRMSCSAAVCFGAYTAIDYAMVSARRKEEPLLNCAVAAAGASGITFLPRGIRYAGGAALIGGALGGVLLGGLRLWRRKISRKRNTRVMITEFPGLPLLLVIVVAEGICR